MSESHSTAPTKPAKPHPDFPLFPHSSGQWAKKIKGKMRYFGRWDDPAAALASYKRFKSGKTRKPVRADVAGVVATAKPSKPTPEFPLFPHGSGQWAKKIRGRVHYFGVWATPDAALEKYTRQKEDLHAGKKPRPDAGEGLTVKQAVNAFLNAAAARRDAGEITKRTWLDYKAAGDILVAHFGKSRLVEDLRPEDFGELRATLAKKWGTGTLGNTINRIRVVLKYASDNRLIDRPVVYGSTFKRPSLKTMRIERARKGAKLFSADDVRRMIDAASPQLRAMLLLAINCGLGNSDVGQLPKTALDLDRGILDYPRPKTGIPRRAVLWPETIEAIAQALAVRPEPKDEAHAALCFITRYGMPWGKDEADSPVTKETKKLMQRLGINGRVGLGFYTLRHVFRTVADEAKDQPACDFVMGHESSHMSTHYRERISDDRLWAVAEYVWNWLFQKACDSHSHQQ